MSKTRADYGLGVARPKIEDKDNFELKGQFLKELRTNTFSSLDHEDANEHIKKVLEIMDLFHIPNITIDQMMLRAFPLSLTGAASRWLKKPSGLITTWEDLKTKFLSKYCLPARTAKKMEEINNFHQEPDENLYQAWKRFKELLMKYPQHYLTDMQEPSSITDGERGFEQTKACYLQEVIPFFKTLKDNFEGIQKALTKEVKEMKDVFEELEAEVSQHAVVRKHDAIELKNLLIANDNLIAECLSQEVFCVATNSELNVARFTNMHVANTTAETRCLALKAKLANLRETNNQDNQKELITHFSKLEVSHLNLQLKYQDLKDQIGNSPPTPDKDTSDFDSVFVIDKMQASLHGKDNVIRQLKKELSQLQVTHQDIAHALRVHAIDSQITKLTDQVTHLQAQNDLFRAENDKIKQHYKELYDSIKITRAKHIEQVTKVTTENMNLKNDVSKATINPLVSARDKHAIDVEPIVLRLRNNRNSHLDYHRHLKESVETIYDIVEESKVELLEYAIGTCPHGSQPRAKQLAHIPLIRKKQVIVAQPSNKLDSTTHPHVVIVTSQKINVHVPPSTGVDCCPIASGSQPMSLVKPNRISPSKGDTKLPIDDKPRNNKYHLQTSTRIDSSSRLKRSVINSHSDFVCQTCAKCVTPSNHDLCVATCLQSAMATPSIHYNRSVERKEMFLDAF
nr:hypothetical protein [Tanacetum cinerariifolium]